MDQTVNLVTRIFSYRFFDYKAFFTFDNAANHTYFETNSFVAKKLNLDIDRK